MVGRIVKVVLAISLLLCMLHQHAHSAGVSVDTLTTVIDANSFPFSQLQAGDTVLLEPGGRDYLLIRNFSGASGNPIIFMNLNGLVTFNTNHYYGISIQNCRYIRLSGTGDEENFYGIRISRVQNGAGIGINDMSSDIEIDHVSVENTMIGGIYAKTDPDCSLLSTRDKFTQYNTVIHDNYIANVGDEGMYIGSTKYFGQHVTCQGKDTLLMPALLDGVKIFNNIVKYTGWDGIQVSSASANCQVYDNLVMYDSQEEYFSQMSGIMLGGGSKCDCYNNYISNGKGSGIESHGLGGYRIFNNIIIDAGRTFQPLDTAQMKYGIYVTDISVQTDSSFLVMHNDIINPKSDGIRFLSTKSKGSLIASNAIINPGNYDYYEHLNTSFTGEDSYVMIPYDSTDVLISNNYFSRNTDGAGFDEANYTLTGNSPLIDTGYPDLKGIEFDGYHNPRKYGAAPDIGVYEFNPQFLGGKQLESDFYARPVVFPNPVSRSLTIQYVSFGGANISLGVFNLQGKRMMQVNKVSLAGKKQEIKIDVNVLPSGIYIYQLSTKKQVVSGKFIKVD